MSEHKAEQPAARRAELEALSMKEVKAEARKAGLTEANIEEADEEEKPKPALINMIINKTQVPGPEELEKMSMKEVKAKAREVGLTQADIEEAEEEEKPKLAIINKIVNKFKAPKIQDYLALGLGGDSSSTDDVAKEMDSSGPSSSHPSSSHEGSDHVGHQVDEASPVPQNMDVVCESLDVMPEVSEALAASEVSEASRDDVSAQWVKVESPDRSTTVTVHEPPSDGHSEVLDRMEASRPATSDFTSSILDLHKVVAGIKDHQRHSAKCKNQDAAFVLGTTGAGKSTTLCWVLGHPPKMEKRSQEVKGRTRVIDVMVVDNPPEGLDIGHNKFKSQTRHLRSYRDPAIPLTWVDTPGWGDTEGSEVDISNAVGIAYTIHSCRSVLPILLISDKALLTERGRYLRTLLGLVTRFITHDFESNISSLQVFFTHVEEGKTSDDLWFLFGEFQEEEKGDPKVDVFLRHVLDLLEKDRDRNMLLLRPIRDKPDAMKKVVQNAPAITNVKEVFGSPLSDSDRSKLNVACEQLVQEVKDSLRDLDFAHLQRVLDTLLLLKKTSNLSIVTSNYKDAGRHVLENFHGKLNSASRSFADNNFASTRQQLENISVQLLVHTNELEEEDESCNPGFQSIKRRREDLVISINRKMEQLRISILKEHGSEDFPKVKYDLDIMQSLSKHLGAELFPESQHAYEESVDKLANRMSEYKQKVDEILVAKGKLGFDMNLITQHVRPSRNSSVQPLTDLTLYLGGLRGASSAGQGHVQEELMTFYKESVQNLQSIVERGKNDFDEQLQLLCKSQDIDVKLWVDQLLSTLLEPWATQDSLSDHVTKEITDAYSQCLHMLEEREVLLSSSLDDSFKRHDFESVAWQLCQLDVLKQVCHNKLIGQRFKDCCKRLTSLVENLAIEIHRWISKEGLTAPSEVFERVSKELTLLQQARMLVSTYFEVGRRACSVSQNGTDPAPAGAAIPENDAVVKFIVSTGLAELCDHFVNALKAQVKDSLESASNFLGINDYRAAGRYIFQMDKMWPLRDHVSDMEGKYKQFAEVMKSYTENLSKTAEEASNPTAASFDPSCIKDSVDLIDGLLGLLQEHKEGCLCDMLHAKATCSESAAPIAQLIATRQTVLKNLDTKLGTLKETALSKIRKEDFEAPIEEMVLLKCVASSLHSLVGERATEMLQSSIKEVDEKLSHCEEKFREALAHEKLQAAEHINAGSVQKMQLLQDFIPRIQSVASSMQREIMARKDSFVQKVSDLLQNGLYDDLNIVMHGAKQQLQGGGPEDSKRWIDAQNLLIGHFRGQYENGRAALREARMSSPVNLSLGNFTRVVEVAAALEKIKANSTDTPSLSILLPEYDNWCRILYQENNSLLEQVVVGGRRALSKWRFSTMPRIREDMKILSNVPHGKFGELCEEELRKFDQGITDKVESLPADLSAMIDYGYNLVAKADSCAQAGEEACQSDSQHKRCTEDNLTCSGDRCEFRCVVYPWRIDMVFDGLLAAFDSPLPHDFDQIYERLTLVLDGKLKALYNAVKVVLRHGNVEAAEALMHGASLLQGSSTISKKTVYTPERHSKIIGELTSLKEEFVTKSHALHDPAGFKKQLDELKDSDYTVYMKMFKPFKADILAEAERLKQDILGFTEFDEDQFGALVDNLLNQHLYSMAIKGHGSTDLHVPQLFEVMRKLLNKVLSIVQRVQASGQVHQAENYSNFLSAAIAHLQATNVEELVKMAEQIKPMHAELVKFMRAGLKEAREGWKLVKAFDICISNPPVSCLIAYMKKLQTNSTCIEEDGDAISFKAAVVFVKSVLENMNIQPLWTECLEPIPKGQEPRLAIALTNLHLFAREFPDLGMGDILQKIHTDVAKHVESLQTETMVKFQHVQKAHMTEDAQKSEWKQINQLMEKSSRAKRALQRFTAIFPSQEEDKTVECMKKVVTDLHNKYVTSGQQDVACVVDHLLSVFRVKCSVSNPNIGQHVNSVIHSFLTTLRRNKSVDFGTLASDLCADPLGGQIVEEFDQFKQFKLDLFKNKTAGMDINHALQQLVDLNKFTPEQKARLHGCWQEYQCSYQKILEKHLFRGGLEALCRDVKVSMKEKALHVSQLLGGICAAVAMHMSDLSGPDSSSVNRKEGMMHPHAVQVLALLRLLRADQPPQSIGSWVWNEITQALGYKLYGGSHLIQIGTGEGKSIVLGVLSIFLSLCGYAVDCVCYSRYLSERDEAAFKGLFVAFGVEAQVRYGTFSALARAHVNEAGDVRKGTKAFVENTLGPGTIRPTRRYTKILLIDEVDVFFSRDFYGELYRPSVLVQAPEITELLKFIWQKRGPGLTLQSVQASAEYGQVSAKYLARLQGVLDSHINAMIHATTTYDKPEHTYEVEDGRIGYVEHGTVNTSIRHGYNTTFSYFHALERGTVKQQVFDEFMGLDIRCGRFSFAEIPHSYERILGVTGTLNSLGEFERGVIKDVYKICEQTIAPSMYGIRDANFDQGVHIESGKSNYYRKILDEINAMIAVDRAVLVFFDSDIALEEFRTSDYGSRLGDASAVTSGNGEYIHHYVKQSTRSKEVTLFPRVFGRGLDFVCYDKKVASQGGVGVVQTFLSEDIAEEIQVKGRTCRQGDKGTYKMILLEEDLTNWHEAKATDSQRKADGTLVKKSQVSPVFIKDELDTHKGLELYNLLHKNRTKWFMEKSKARRRTVDAAKKQHEFSSDFQRMLCNPSSTTPIDLTAKLSNMNQSLVPSSNHNIVFCLDESGSMNGQPWVQLTQAFKQFVRVCLDHGEGGDLISVVQFSHIARITLERKTLKQAEAQNLVMQPGLTNFKPALDIARDLFNKAEGFTPLLVFMSDGVNDDGDVSPILKSMAAEFSNLQCHIVFFGRSSGSDNLKRMATAVPGGKFHLSVDGMELTRTFSSIAAEVTAL